MTPDSEEKKHTRRAWKIFGAMGLLLVVALVIALRIDDPLEDNAAVAPHFTPGGGEENPLAVFVREIEAHPVSGFDQLPQDVRMKKPGTEAAMLEFLNKQIEPRGAYDRLMRTDPAGWRWPKVKDHLKFDTDVSYLPKIQTVANMQSMHIRVLAHQGKAAEATAEALKVTQCGSALLRAEGSLIHWLVALTIRRIGEAALEAALKGADVTPELLRHAQEDLADLEIRRADLGFSIRVETVFFRDLVLDPKQLARQHKSLMLDDGVQFLIKPHQTINAHQAAFVPLLRALELADFSALGVVGKELDARANAEPKRISANAAGDRLLQLSLEMYGKIIAKAQSAPAYHRQTVIILAMRRFELGKGRLPAALDELVPQYLSSVPLDPFDGAPMRWNAAKQIVYSVGSDLDDDGGKVKLHPRDTYCPDVGLRYWWAPPEPEPEPPARPLVKPRKAAPAR